MCKFDEATQALSEAIDCTYLYSGYSTRELYGFIKLETGICRAHGKDPELWVPLIAKKRIARKRARRTAVHGFSCYGGDAQVSIEPCPDHVVTREDAERYAEGISIPYIWRDYSPTGQIYTAWTRVGMRHGKWYVWHCRQIDC